MPSDENEDKGKGKKKEENSFDGSTNLTYNDELLLVEEHDIVDNASSWVIDSSTSVHVTSSFTTKEIIQASAYSALHTLIPTGSTNDFHDL